MEGMTFRRATWGAAALVLAACATQPTIRSVVHPDASKKTYRTVAYGGEREPPVGFDRYELRPEAREAVDAAIKEQLIEVKGYARAPLEEADLILLAGAGRKVETDRIKVPRGSSYSYGSLQIPNYDEYEERIDTRTLSIDVFERESGLHVWHGHVEALATPEGKPVNVARVRQAAARLFSRFPPAASAQ